MAKALESLNSTELDSIKGILGITDFGSTDPTKGAALVQTPRGKVSDALTFITPRQRGSSITVDSTWALEDALTIGRTDGVPILINERIKIDGAIEVAGNVSIRGTGIIDLSGGGSLKFGTGVTRIPNLAQDITFFGNNVVFTQPHGLVQGDVFAVWNPTDFSQSEYRYYYRAGDMFKVAKVISSTEVKIYGSAKSTFSFNSVQVFKLNGGSFSLEDVGIIPATTNIPLFLDGLVGVKLIRPRIFPGAPGAAIELHRCFDFNAVAPEITTLSEADGYPIVISNSQNGVVNGSGSLGSGWHCIAIGGRDGDATVPSADLIISDFVCRNQGSVGVGCIESHGGTKRIVYDNIVTDVVNLSGEDITLRNSTVYGRPIGDFADGNCIYGSEVDGGAFILENIRSVTAGNGLSFSSFLELGISKRSKPLSIVMRNIFHENKGSSWSTDRIIGIVDTYENGPTVDITIDGFKYSADGAPFSIIAYRGDKDVSNITTISISNYQGPTPSLTLASSNSGNYNIPLQGNYRENLTGVISRGDVSVTLSADRASASLSPRTNIWSTDLTDNRTVTLSTTRARSGDVFRIVRSGGSTGGPFTLNVSSGSVLTTLTQNQWCEVVYVNSSWVVSAKGSLT